MAVQKSHYGLAGRPSRRHVVKAGAVITAAAAASTALPGILGTAEAAAEGGPYDVIVIGAGFAGITAARDLRLMGKRVLILEARHRIGGRTWTTSFAGHRIEMGGTWVESTQPHIGAELRRYGISLVADGAAERTFFPTPEGPAEFSTGEGFARLGATYEQIFDGSREYFERPFEPLYRADLLKDVDRMSLRERLDQMRLTPEQELMVDGQTAVYSGGSSTDGALTMLAQWWALSGWNNDAWNETMTYRMETDTVGLLHAMLDEARPTLRLGAPVSRVTRTGAAYHVMTRSGAVFRAPSVVVAVPVNVWKTINFTPALPAAQATAAAQGIGVRTGTKLWIHASSPQGRFYAQGAEGGSPITMLVPDKATERGNLYAAFSTDPTFDPTDRGQVTRAARQLGADLQIHGIRAQSWGSDEFSRGGWAFRKPGQLTALYPEVQSTENGLTFASGDIADGWSGYIDGAIESGARAARDLLTS